MAERPHPTVEPKDIEALASSEQVPVTDEGSAALLGDALVRARPEPPAALPLAQARVAAALFGPVPSGRFGRFRVLERLGAGAMGVVYAAYDPDLDRGVALKLVNVPGRSREIALAEAKALARLSHPNVVPVHDVGFEGDWVYIVLELVRGETLDRWAKGRDTREILDAYRQAGEALAAAHAAGLVHRDFKPTNALVGRDGRVRVVDFGLACEASMTVGDRPSIAGTPRYMAPEQAAGHTVTPAADQYSFSVALREALIQEQGLVPRWVEVVLERARAGDPAARFASMRDVLRALARDPTRVWTSRLVMASLAGFAGLALVAGRFLIPPREDACRTGDRFLADSWPTDARASASAKIQALGPYGATLAPWVDQALGDYSQRWASGYRDACVSRRDHLQSDALVDRRMACLDRGRNALRLVAVVAESADAKTLPDVARVIRAMPDPSDCMDLQSLLAGLDPPPAPLRERVGNVRKRIDEARLLVIAGQYKRAHAMAHGAIDEARSFSYRPLLAEALLVDGHATMTNDPPSEAINALDEAATIAFEIGSDALGVEAWARRAWLQGTVSADATALAGLDVVEAVAARPPVGGFARALLYNNVGSVELARERRDLAAAAFERALRESRGVAGPGAVELVNVRMNLGLAIDDPARRDALFVEAEDEMTKLLGADHPDTLGVRWVRAMAEVGYARALELMTPTCQGLELHESLGARAARCWSEVGFLEREVGDEREAAQAMGKAIGSDGQRADAWAEARPYWLLWRGDTRGAVDGFRAAVAARGRPPPNEPWWGRRERATLELGLGRAYLAAGDVKIAQQSLEASVAELVAIERDHPKADVRRRLARARIELARALARAGRKDVEVAELAGSALAWLTEAGASKQDLVDATRLSERR